MDDGEALHWYLRGYADAQDIQANPPSMEEWGVEEGDGATGDAIAASPGSSPVLPSVRAGCGPDSSLTAGRQGAGSDEATDVEQATVPALNTLVEHSMVLALSALEREFRTFSMPFSADRVAHFRDSLVASKFGKLS